MLRQTKLKVHLLTAKTPNIHWTRHSEMKMKFYNLSKQRVRRILNLPKRKEEGIAPDTIALMQPAGSKKHPYEIWVMLQKHQQKAKAGKEEIIKIISAWKYPGKTKPRSETSFDFLQKEYSDYVSNEIQE